ncbi:MAG: hypothetical protein KGI00_05560, partial [Candidatus Micrarchaeota archaeon]|nr:hypothetical protein [Candidatus Micrarchaeota archaeon]
MLEKLKGRNLFLVLAILIVLMGIYIRAIMLKHPGFFEPDVYFYYSILRETIQNGFVVPAYSYLSGFPVHNHIGEAPGIVYASAIPYFFLRYIGISYYTVMRLVPIFFGVLTILGTYLLSRRLSKNSWFGLLVLFLAAVSIGSLSRTSGTEYRGDSFISPFLLVSLYLMLKGVEGEGKRTDYHLMLLSAFVLSLGSMVWNGFPYTYATYLMATALISVYAFISGKEKLLRMNSVAVLGLLLAYLLQHLYAYIGLSRSSLPMTGLDFFILYIPVLAGSLLAYYALMDKGRFAVLISHRNRAIAVFACLVISVVLLSGLFAHYYNTIFGQKAIGQTTLELQPTTLSFVASILNIQLLLAPLGILFFLFLAHYAEDKEHHKAWALRLSMSPAFLAIASYVAITGILQGSVLRFNAIFAVPMVIFAAYGMFVPGALMKKYAEGIQGRRMVKTAAAIALAACLLISLYFIMPFSILGSYFVVGAILRAI